MTPKPILVMQTSLFLLQAVAFLLYKHQTMQPLISSLQREVI